MTIIATAGSWNKKDCPLYFVAANMETLRLASACTKHVLVAVNELESERDIKSVHDFVEAGKSVFIDSGVYNLSTQHAITHNVSMDVALGMAPDKIDGFDHLFAQYTQLITDIGHKVWGYIEIDQGGRENKIKTRARLEGLGFRPIPVYHPFNDGWDYFDYLAKRYDRICFGNVVQADPPTRKRLIATAWERRRKYPHLWIHALGMTPSETTAAFPINSCDSSRWIGLVRWGHHQPMFAGTGEMDPQFVYDTRVDPSHSRGHRKSRLMCAFDALNVTRTMQNMVAAQVDELGADPGMFTK